MKATGIVRKVDDLGRVVVPKELRRTFGISIGDPMEFYVEDDAIVLKKFDTAADLEQMLDRLESSLTAKEDLVVPEQLNALLDKVKEMRAIVKSKEN